MVMPINVKEFDNFSAISWPFFVQNCEFRFFTQNAKFRDFVRFSSKTNFLCPYIYLKKGSHKLSFVITLLPCNDESELLFQQGQTTKMLPLDHEYFMPPPINDRCGRCIMFSGCPSVRASVWAHILLV